jgi:hypothetical protein
LAARCKAQFLEPINHLPFSLWQWKHPLESRDGTSRWHLLPTCMSLVHWFILINSNRGRFMFLFIYNTMQNTSIRWFNIAQEGYHVIYITAVGRVWIKSGKGGEFRQILKKKDFICFQKVTFAVSKVRHLPHLPPLRYGHVHVA